MVVLAGTVLCFLFVNPSRRLPARARVVHEQSVKTRATRDLVLPERIASPIRVESSEFASF